MLDTKAVCEILGITPARVIVLKKQGKLTGTQQMLNGRKTNLYDEASVIAFRDFTYKRVCECGVTFETKSNSQKHCNEACRRKRRKPGRRDEPEPPPRIKPCSVCGSIHCQPTEDKCEIYVVCLNCGRRTRGIKQHGTTCLTTEIKAIALWNRSN